MRPTAWVPELTWKKSIRAVGFQVAQANARMRFGMEEKMQKKNLAEELKNNAYPGRGIVIGKTPDGKKAVTAYFIMGRSANSRNRIFVEDGEGIRTQAFDPS